MPSRPRPRNVREPVSPSRTALAGAMLLGGLLLGAMLFGAAPGLVATAAAQEPLLQDFQAVLPRLQPARRETLRQRAAQWAQWSPRQRQAFARRAAEWDALPLAERGARRERYRAWQALTPAQQRRLQATHADFAGLPAERRQALRKEFAQLDRSVRRGWLLGPELGADYAQLQPLLAQVPAAEHAALLEVLRGMTGRQRDDLAVLVQRTPPQDRAALRRELVSTAAANRDDWLWDRLGR